MQLINEKISKDNTTIDNFFHKLTLSYSNTANIKDIVFSLNLPDNLSYVFQELAHYFNSKNGIQIVQLAELCHKIKFTPKSIQNILQIISFRLQLKKIARENISNILTLKRHEIKNVNALIEILTTQPIELEKNDSIALCTYLFPESNFNYSAMHLSSAISIRLGH